MLYIEDDYSQNRAPQIWVIKPLSNIGIDCKNINPDENS